MTPALIIDNTQARIDRIEQRIRSLHVSDGVIGWDGYDDLPVAALSVEFRRPDIKRYTRIGCPRIHLQLYSAGFSSFIEWCHSVLVCIIEPFED